MIANTVETAARVVTETKNQTAVAVETDTAAEAAAESGGMMTAAETTATALKSVDVTQIGAAPRRTTTLWRWQLMRPEHHSKWVALTTLLVYPFPVVNPLLMISRFQGWAISQ